MKRALRQLVLACAGLVVAAFVASGGSAGPRDANATFEAFPGPGSVTYGELIAYRATFENASGSTLTKVRFRQTVPAAQGVDATFDSSTCPSTPTTVTLTNGTREWVCDFGSVSAGASELALTIVWRVPTLASTSNCDGCLVSTGRWTVKEGTNDVSDPNDAFGLTTVPATLLASGAGAAETLRAGGYETGAASCAEPTAAGNLRTNPALGVANPLSTKFCLPAFTIPAGSGDLGYATTITETAGNARHAEVCIAQLGTNCGPSSLDARFGIVNNVAVGPFVTLVFQVADAALPKGYKINTVSHNGVAMTPATCAATGDCVLSIDLDNRTKVWTIVVTSSENGFYDW